MLYAFPIGENCFFEMSIGETFFIPGCQSELFSENPPSNREKTGGLTGRILALSRALEALCHLSSFPPREKRPEWIAK